MDDEFCGAKLDALVGYLGAGTTYASMTFAAGQLSVNPTAKKINLTGVVSKPLASQFLIT